MRGKYLSIAAVVFAIAVGITTVSARQNAAPQTDESTRFTLYPSHWMVLLTGGGTMNFGSSGKNAGEYSGRVDLAGGLTIVRNNVACAYFPATGWSGVLDEDKVR